MDLIPKPERSPEEGNGNSLQYSCWEIPGTEESGGLPQLLGYQELEVTERLSNNNKT